MVKRALVIQSVGFWGVAGADLTVHLFLSLISVWDQVQEAQVSLVSCFPLARRSRQEACTQEGSETNCVAGSMGWASPTIGQVQKVQRRLIPS